MCIDGCCGTFSSICLHLYSYYRYCSFEVNVWQKILSIPILPSGWIKWFEKTENFQFLISGFIHLYLFNLMFLKYSIWFLLRAANLSLCLLQNNASTSETFLMLNAIYELNAEKRSELVLVDKFCLYQIIQHWNACYILVMLMYLGWTIVPSTKALLNTWCSKQCLIEASFWFPFYISINIYDDKVDLPFIFKK